MSGMLQTWVSTFSAALVRGALGWVAMRAGSGSVAQGTGRIVPNPTVVCAIAAGCFALGGVAIYAALFHDGGIAAWCVGLPSVSFGILMLLGLSPRMAVTWDPVRLEGPASYGMPPFGRMAGIVLSGPDVGQVFDLGNALMRSADPLRAIGAEVWGPAAAPIARVRRRHRVRLLVKAPKGVPLQDALRTWLAPVRLRGQLRLSVDIDPQSFL